MLKNHKTIRSISTLLVVFYCLSLVALPACQSTSSKDYWEVIDKGGKFLLNPRTVNLTIGLLEAFGGKDAKKVAEYIKIFLPIFQALLEPAQADALKSQLDTLKAAQAKLEKDENALDEAKTAAYDLAIGVKNHGLDTADKFIKDSDKVTLLSQAEATLVFLSTMKNEESGELIVELGKKVCTSCPNASNAASHTSALSSLFAQGYNDADFIKAIEITAQAIKEAKTATPATIQVVE